VRLVILIMADARIRLVTDRNVGVGRDGVGTATAWRYVTEAMGIVRARRRRAVSRRERGCCRSQ
jgi:hypothetical protein